ncbi:MAG: hypothetical protein M3245_03130 [Actinomycetota bacterium]|nr:hypothetical protein [Actinomycetota bacterium]
MTHHDHVHEPPPERPVRTGDSLTGFAFVKYGFILAMTIVILYFLARYVLPLFRG